MTAHGFKLFKKKKRSKYLASTSAANNYNYNNYSSTGPGVELLPGQGLYRLPEVPSGRP